MNTISPEVAVIYNRLNMDAVIATAIMLKERPDARAFDITQLAPTDSMRYVWIGIDPRVAFKEFYFKVSSRVHTFIIDDGPIQPLKLQLHPFKTRFPEMKEPKEGENEADLPEVVKSLVSKLCEEFAYDAPGYRKLGFKVSHFLDKKTEIEDVIFVYTNARIADWCIAHCEPFQINDAISKEQRGIYMNEVKRVKGIFDRGYRHGRFVDGTKVRMAVHTSISDVSFHLALRLIRLAHKNFVNMTMGLSGPIAYTNMRHLVFDTKNQHPIIAH